MSAAAIPTPDDVLAARQRIQAHVHNTPVIRGRSLDERSGARMLCKCENLQRGGAFKLRGALNAVLHAGSGPFVTHSSGNHAAALSLAARLAGHLATVVMPENANQAKVDAVRGYGGEIVFCEATLEAREATAARLVRDRGARLIHPYADALVIAGQGTAALELLREHPDLQYLVVPVGGGGLLGGTALAAAGTSPNTQVIGMEPEAADDAARSLASGKLLPSVNPQTVADGLLTSLGQLNFDLIRRHVAAILTVSEAEIIAAMRFFWQRTKLLIEPSSAVAIAGVFRHSERFRGCSVGVVLSGGNVDLDRLPW